MVSHKAEVGRKFQCLQGFSLKLIKRNVDLKSVSLQLTSRFWDDQAEGKKRMKAVGRVDVPQDAFMAVLRLEKEVL